MKLMLALLVSTSAAFEIAKAKAPMLKAAAPAPVKADKVLALRGGGALGPVSPEIGIYIWTAACAMYVLQMFGADPTVPDATMKYSSTRRPSQRLFYSGLARRSQSAPALSFTRSSSSAPQHWGCARRGLC